MAQDQGVHTLLTEQALTMVDKLLGEAVGPRYEPGTLHTAVSKRVAAFLEGGYTARDAAGLITYDVIRLVVKKGDIITALPAILALEASLFAHFKAS